MSQLLYATVLTQAAPVAAVVIEEYNFCELSRAVLYWEGSSVVQPEAQWLVEVCPGPANDFFSVCRLTCAAPEAHLSCIALPDGKIRLSALNDAARRARGVAVHVTGDLDPTGELESFYAVSCAGNQDWLIKSEVGFFETFSVVIKNPELVRPENRVYVQLQAQGQGAWANVACISGDRMWALIENRLVVKGDKIRCQLAGRDAAASFTWDAVTTLEDLGDNPEDDFEPELAEAEEAPAEAEQEDASVEVIDTDESVEDSAAGKRRRAEDKQPLPLMLRCKAARKAMCRSYSTGSDGCEVRVASATDSPAAPRRRTPPNTGVAAAFKATCRPSTMKSQPAAPAAAPPAAPAAAPPAKADAAALDAARTGYLNELRAAVQEMGPCRLSALGARVKRPAGVEKLIDFLKKSGEFTIMNTDVVTMRTSK